MANVTTVTGTVERLTNYGVVLDGQEYRYSNSFTGARLDKAAVGTKATLAVDQTERGSYIVDPKGHASQGGGKSGKFFPGAPRGRFSPEEIELKKAEGPRIARSVAVEHSVVALTHGIDAARILETAQLLENYILTGRKAEAVIPAKPAPSKVAGPAPAPAPDVKTPAPDSSAVAPSAKAEAPVRDPKNERPTPAKASIETSSKAKRVAPKEVNDLLKVALQAGYSLREFQELAKLNFAKSPYQLTVEEFVQFTEQVRALERSAA